MSNFFVQELVLYRHFMLIDSPIPFELVANPTNYRKDERGNVLNVDMSEITGRDICSRPAGAWRVDCWTLLPEKYHKQNPVFTMLIKYDRDLLDEGEEVDIRYSDIDIGEGVAGVNGQLVDIPASAFRPVVDAIESASVSIVDKINLVKSDTNSIHFKIEQGNGIMSGISSDTDTIRSDVGSISDDISTIRSDVVDISGDTTSIKSDVGEVVRLLGSLENGTVLNQLEQIRTVLNSPASAGASTPWGSILLRLRDIIPHSAYWSFSDFAKTAQSGFFEGYISFPHGSDTYYISGRFLIRKSIDINIYSVNAVCCGPSHVLPCMFRGVIRSASDVSGSVSFNGVELGFSDILDLGLRSVL